MLSCCTKTQTWHQMNCYHLAKYYIYILQYVDAGLLCLIEMCYEFSNAGVLRVTI